MIETKKALADSVGCRTKAKSKKDSRRQGRKKFTFPRSGGPQRAQKRGQDVESGDWLVLKMFASAVVVQFQKVWGGEGGAPVAEKI